LALATCLLAALRLVDAITLAQAAGREATVLYHICIESNQQRSLIHSRRATVSMGASEQLTALPHTFDSERIRRAPKSRLIKQQEGLPALQDSHEEQRRQQDGDVDFRFQA